jgi:LysR family transcriptional regulator, transcriptional activator of nhaA
MLLINHHHLYYFWVAAKAGSIAQACAALNLAQPTVSAQIIKLEKDLKRTLFERRRRGLELTEDGRLVMDYANQIFNYSQEMVDALQDRPGGRRIRVQIGIVDQVSKEIAQALLAALFKGMPQAMATVHEGRPAPLLADLKSHTLDVVLSNAPLPVEDADDYRKAEIGRLPVHFAAAPALARKVRRFPADLKNVPLLLPTRASPIWSQVEQFLSRQQIAPHVLAEIQDAELLHRLALLGEGAAPLDRMTMRDAVKEGGLVRLNARPTGIEETFWLVTKKRHRLNPAADYLLENFRIRE